MHHVQLQAIKDFVLQNKKKFISAWQHLHEDIESCVFYVTFNTRLILTWVGLLLGHVNMHYSQSIVVIKIVRCSFQ
jgi:hypothetical protein